jgi:hypothetical protein
MTTTIETAAPELDSLNKGILVGVDGRQATVRAQERPAFAGLSRSG